MASQDPAQTSRKGRSWCARIRGGKWRAGMVFPTEGTAVAKAERERESAVICKKRRWERRGTRLERPQEGDCEVSRG